jgi:hypothetical protein
VENQVRRRGPRTGEEVRLISDRPGGNRVGAMVFGMASKRISVLGSKIGQSSLTSKLLPPTASSSLRLAS